MATALLALFPFLLMFAPRLALGGVGVAIVLLYRNHMGAARRTARRYIEDNSV